MSKLYTAIGIIMLLASCKDKGELSGEQKLEVLQKQVHDKLSTKNAEKLLDSLKAIYGDSLNYVSDIYIAFEKDTSKSQNK